MLLYGLLNHAVTVGAQALSETINDSSCHPRVEASGN